MTGPAHYNDPPLSTGAKVMQQLAIILPTYNERENLAPMLSALLGLDLDGVRQRVWVVDDNSPDGTGELADQWARQEHDRVRVVHRPQRRGLGPAYIHGFREALADGADLVLQMDCDFSHSPLDVRRLMAMLPDADAVFGSRFVRDGSVAQNWPVYRKLLSRFANGVYVRFLLGMGVHDATGGFRLWRREVLEAIDPAASVASKGYAFQIEMAYLATKLGFRVREAPIHFPDRQRGESKMSLRIQMEAARQVLAMRRRHRHRRRVSTVPMATRDVHAT